MSEQKRVKIVSNGGRKISVVDVESGEPIRHIVSVDWRFKFDELPTATVKVLFAEVDVETGAEVIAVCPECGEGAAIEELRRLRAENGALRDHVERLEQGQRA
jgi:hypothetical protein